jgi:hypothetical protein
MRTMPDEPVEHGPQSHFRHIHGLDADGIVAAAREALRLPAVVPA